MRIEIARVVGGSAANDPGEAATNAQAQIERVASLILSRDLFMII